MSLNRARFGASIREFRRVQVPRNCAASLSVCARRLDHELPKAFSDEVFPDSGLGPRDAPPRSPSQTVISVFQSMLDDVHV